MHGAAGGCAGPPAWHRSLAGAIPGPFPLVQPQPHASQVAIYKSQLAQIFQQNSRLPEAVDLFAEAVASCERTLGPDHPDLAVGLSKLSAALKDSHDFGQSEVAARRALAISTKALGENHPDVAIRLSGLASVLIARDRLGEAEGLAERALAITRDRLPDDNPEVSYRRQTLAEVYAKQGRHAAAADLLRTSLAAVRKRFHATHPSVAYTTISLADTLIPQVCVCSHPPSPHAHVRVPCVRLCF